MQCATEPPRESRRPSDPAQTLLIAAVGCNMAWGLLDGVMYVATSQYQRGTGNRLISAVHTSTDQQITVQIK